MDEMILNDKPKNIFNEQKMRDIDTSIYMMEQKIDKLEMVLQCDERFDNDLMTDMIAKKIDQRPQ